MTAAAHHTRPALVLLATAEDWTARALEGILGQHGYAVLRARSTMQGIGLVETARPDAIIVDADLPGGGIELCIRLQGEGRVRAGTPIVMTAGAANSRMQRSAAYAAGVWEFCVEPIDTESLLAKLATYIRVKLAGDRLQRAALVEPGSGLYTMPGLVRRAKEISADATRRHAPVTCIALAVNPGPAAEPRPAANEVAARVGRQCRATLRSSDVVGRVAETEFAILAVDAADSGASRIVDRLRMALTAEFLSCGGVQLGVAVAGVGDLATSPLDAVELLYQATSRLRVAAPEENGYHPGESRAPVA